MWKWKRRPRIGRNVTERLPNGIARIEERTWIKPARRLKQYGRLPPAYFAPSHFGKDAFLKDENVFFFKILCFFIIFSNFSNFNFYLIFAKKTSKIRWKDICKKIPFETHSRKNLPHLAILKNFKFFFEKPICFSKKNPNFERFEDSYFLSRILRQICYNLVNKKRSERANIVLARAQLANIG